MLNIKQWMDQTRLKMNPSKTEFIYFGHPKQLCKCEVSEISIAGDLIQRVDLIRYLSVWMDSSPNFKQHITKKCQCAMINLLKMRHIRHLLDQDTTAHLSLSLCISHLDYCNSVLVCLPDSTIQKYQHIQNMCARLVLRRTKRCSITQCLKELHWLPIHQRIIFKLMVLTYKCLHGVSPEYLRNLPTPKKCTQRVMRSDQLTDLPVIPATKRRTFVDRSFSVAAPVICNQLPDQLRQAENLLKFKKLLKTHLFNKAFTKD